MGPGATSTRAFPLFSGRGGGGEGGSTISSFEGRRLAGGVSGFGASTGRARRTDVSGIVSARGGSAGGGVVTDGAGLETVAVSLAASGAVMVAGADVGAGGIG